MLFRSMAVEEQKIFTIVVLLHRKGFLVTSKISIRKTMSSLYFAYMEHKMPKDR